MRSQQHSILKVTHHEIAVKRATPSMAFGILVVQSSENVVMEEIGMLADKLCRKISHAPNILNIGKKEVL